MISTTIRNSMLKQFLATAAITLSMVAFMPESRADLRTADAILPFFDAAVAAGNLVGTGSDPLIQAESLEDMRGKYVTTDNLLDKGERFFKKACDKLINAQFRTDGKPKPGDKVAGPAAPTLAQMTDDFRKAVGCSVTAVAPGEGGTIEGEGDTSITVETGAVPYEALFGIEPALGTQIAADHGGLGLSAAVEITFAPTAPGGSNVAPAEPFQITIPANTDLKIGDLLIVGRQVDVFNLQAGTPVMQTVFQAVALATVVESQAGNVIQTLPSELPGILTGGIFSFIVLPDPELTGASNSHTAGPFPGTATGHVATSGGADAVGATVSSSAAPWIALTDAAGNYSIPVIAATTHEFTVNAFAPLNGESGTFTGAFPPSPGPNPTFPGANIALVSPVALPTSDGIRNGGFERGNLSSWIFDDGSGGPTAAAFILQQFGPTADGPTCTTETGTVYCDPVVNVPGGDIIMPTEGEWMAAIATGPGSATASTRLRQSFIVPSGVHTLRFDFNFVSEEFPEWIGTAFNDTFSAVITTPNGNQTIAQVRVNDYVNNPGGIELIGDCGFSGGDRSCGKTGWMVGSVDLSAWAGTNTPITVELVFKALDFGDEIYDTFVFLDNIRFSTLWLDVKTLSDGGSNATGADAARVKADIRRANEILSQAGVNIQVRDHAGQPFQADTVATAEVDVNVEYDDINLGLTQSTATGEFLGATCGGKADTLSTSATFEFPPGSGMIITDDMIVELHAHLTQEEVTVVNSARSPNAKDLNVYYGRQSEEPTLCAGGGLGCRYGFALGPDDFCDPASVLASPEPVQGDHVELAPDGTQTNVGVLMFDKAAADGFGGEVLAHEIIHILLNPYNSASRQEHGDSPNPAPGGVGPQTDTANIMNNLPSTALINITRDQSEIINKSPLLVD